MSEEHDGRGVKRLGFYRGTVLDNKDPLGIGRVQLAVPGLVEKSGWATPLGVTGGGAANRGWYDPPDVGADVAVFFEGGEVERPAFLPAGWPAPGGKSTAPGPVGGYAPNTYAGAPGTPQDIAPEERHLVKAYQIGPWCMVFDARPGKERFVIENKKSGDHLMLDGANNRGELRVTSLLRVICDGILRLEGGQVTVAERPVLPNGKVLP